MATLTKPTLNPDAKAKLDAILQESTASGTIPAATFAVATPDAELYLGVSGDKVYGQPDKGPIDQDTIIQLMSMTKLVASVAALQLVEAGKLSIDDPSIIERNLPELWQLDIITKFENGEPVFTKRTQPITLRHLLTHTNGSGYDLMVPLLGQWAKAVESPGVFASNLTVKHFESPLLFEPGQGWNYGLGHDWIGILVERLTGQSLGEYFKEHVFEPTGASSLTFYPTEDQYKRMQAPTTRTEDGKLVVFPGIREDTPEKLKGQASGGAGLWGTARDYLRVLQGIMRSSQPGGIISPESYKLIFSDQLPSAPEGTFRGQIEFSRLIPHVPKSLQESGNLKHSLGGFLSTADSPHGRKAGSDWWEGILKTFYWMDPATGICGVFTTQLFAFGVPNEPFDAVYNKLERAVYDSLS